MKSKYIILIMGILLMCSIVSGQDKNSSSFYATPEEAVKKATSDLQEILRSGMDLNLGINSEQLAKSEMGAEIYNLPVKFDLLLRAEANTPLTRLTEKNSNHLYPLYYGNQIVSIVEVKQAGERWQIGGFTSQSNVNDLNQILQSFRGLDKKNIKIMEIQNLNAVVYEINVDGKSLYFSNYNDIFSLKEPIPSERLIPILVEDANKFQKEFGSALKKEKLVK